VSARSKNRAVASIFGSRRDEVAGGWRKLREALHNLYYRRINPVIHCKGGWVGPRAGLDVVVKRKSSNMTVFWDVAPCCIVEVYRRFRGAYYLHLQGDELPLKRREISTRLHGATSQKTAIFILAAVRT
jgi:hypothetical protein